LGPTSSFDIVEEAENSDWDFALNLSQCPRVPECHPKSPDPVALGNVLATLLAKPDFCPMNFPPYWAKANSADFVCWRWSSQSVLEAQQLAKQAVDQLADRFGAGGFPPQRGGYYPDRPFREQVLHEIRNDSGEVYAVVTRNSYGCLVLNTSRVMFVDIDLALPKASGGILRRWFGKSEPGPPAQSQNQALARIEEWTRGHAQWGWRIYQTRAGLRLLATQGVVAADSADAQEVFEALGADPLYRKLCKTQRCYRARLTPKPWRCGIRSKPERWPLLDARAEKRFLKWQTQYESYSFNWSTCQLLRQIGNPSVHPEVQSIIALHDGPTRVESSLELA
jgi:hypothetical protein